MYKLVRTSFATDEISLKNNKLKLGNFKLLPNLKREIGKVKDDVYFCRLILDITDNPTNRFPVDVHIKFVGVFEFKDYDNENELYDFLKKDAVHTMYPYLRAMLSNLATNAMMPTIILTIIDDTKLLTEESYTIIN